MLLGAGLRGLGGASEIANKSSSISLSEESRVAAIRPHDSQCGD